MDTRRELKVRIPAALKLDLERLAREMDLSQNQVCVRALREFVRGRELDQDDDAECDNLFGSGSQR